MNYPNTWPTPCHLFRTINTQSRTVHLSLKGSTPCGYWRDPSIFWRRIYLLAFRPTLPLKMLKKDWTLTKHYWREPTYLSKISWHFYSCPRRQFLCITSQSFPSNFRLPDEIPSQCHFSQSRYETCRREDSLIGPSPLPPFKWLFRYADESHVCVKREQVDEFHSHLNSINPRIKFIIEIESEGSIAFLNTNTTRQEDGSITVSVYKKATNTDRCFDFKSHHQPQDKHSVVRTLMNRAKNIPSTGDEVTRETKRVAKALAANKYPVDFIHNVR